MTFSKSSRTIARAASRVAAVRTSKPRSSARRGRGVLEDFVVVHHQDGRIERCVGGIDQYPFLFSWRRAKQSRFYREKANKEEGAATICHIP